MRLAPFPMDVVPPAPLEGKTGHLWLRHFTGFLSAGPAASLLTEAHAMHPQSPGEKAFPKGR